MYLFIKKIERMNWKLIILVSHRQWVNRMKNGNVVGIGGYHFLSKK